jgi:hypothetical protein
VRNPRNIGTFWRILHLLNQLLFLEKLAHSHVPQKPQHDARYEHNCGRSVCNGSGYLLRSCVFPSSFFFVPFFIMYNPTSRKTIPPKTSGPKYTRLKPVLIAKVYQNTVNRIHTEIAENTSPYQKILVFSPSNMALQPPLLYKTYKAAQGAIVMFSLFWKRRSIARLRVF